MLRPLVALLVVLVGMLAGCSPTLQKPRLMSPGPAEYQRANAIQFDPYPQNDMGPPIDGGRPPGYAKPPNEVERARQYRPAGPWANPTPSGVTPMPIPTGAPLY
jgi:hypothetical protein